MAAELRLRQTMLAYLKKNKLPDKDAAPLLVGAWLDTRAVPALHATDGHRALELLTRMGHEAEYAVPHLLAALREKDDKALSDCLFGIGDAAVPPLARALEDLRQPGFNLSVLAALQTFGPRARPALGAIFGALHSPNEEVRKAAAETFGLLGPAAKEAVPKLQALLTDADADLRRHAAVALGLIGPPAKAALPALVALFKDDTEATRQAAVRAAGRMGPAAVEPLTAALDDPSDKVRLGALEALGHLGPEARPALPALRKLAQGDPRAEVREAARALLEKLDAQ